MCMVNMYFQVVVVVEHGSAMWAFLVPILIIGQAEGTNVHGIYIYGLLAMSFAIYILL